MAQLLVCAVSASVLWLFLNASVGRVVFCLSLCAALDLVLLPKYTGIVVDRASGILSFSGDGLGPVLFYVAFIPGLYLALFWSQKLLSFFHRPDRTDSKT